MEGQYRSDPTKSREGTGYMPIENYGLIGNMRTCALVATDGGLDYMCWPHFDSPSVFCRLLDQNKGGHFTICPRYGDSKITTKQQYLPGSNVLQTRYLNDAGVLNLNDFFPRPPNPTPPSEAGRARTIVSPKDELKKWLVRRVECIRGEVDVEVNVMPAFNYAQDKHSLKILSQKCESDKGGHHQKAVFASKSLTMELEATLDCGDEPVAECPLLRFVESKELSELGQGVVAQFTLKEGQAVSFIFRESSAERDDDVHLTTALIDQVQEETRQFWFNWISQSFYKGRWQEVVARSLMILKLLTFEPTGAIIAAPTFSVPEAFGGTRNWDYRYCWVRDSSFTIYILLRMGFKSEAEAYMNFISDRFQHSRTPDGALPIMFSIHGETDLPELELSHLEGYRQSKPVRIGNGAAFHKQLDIYGELLDALYLYNKYGKQISYDQWKTAREIVDYVCNHWQEDDMSIWEVRGPKQNFVYSKIMLWVAIDRAIRLSDQRSNLPAPQRAKWLATRNAIYEDVMEKGYNEKLGCFVQSYENNEVLDSAVLIAPLVFFIAPNDPRFTSTLEAILRPPEKGGLMSTGLVYRYDTALSDDGVGGIEGTFALCTFWLVEALTRAGFYEKKYLVKAINTFENVLGYSNHLGMFSEEVSRSGEQLGNMPQAFSHLSLISAAFNLDRVSAARSVAKG